MSNPADRDPLAAWTYTEAGEEIADGHLRSLTPSGPRPGGRRWRSAPPRCSRLTGNSAAEQYAAGGLPEGQDVMRVWRPRAPAELRARLIEPPLAVRAEGDVLHVLWQGEADEVWLSSWVQPWLWPVEGIADLWEASLRIRRWTRR